jgi:hypothetical protein
VRSVLHRRRRPRWEFPLRQARGQAPLERMSAG